MNMLWLIEVGDVMVAVLSWLSVDNLVISLKKKNKSGSARFGWLKQNKIIFVSCIPSFGLPKKSFRANKIKPFFQTFFLIAGAIIATLRGKRTCLLCRPALTQRFTGISVTSKVSVKSYLKIRRPPWSRVWFSFYGRKKWFHFCATKI